MTREDAVKALEARLRSDDVIYVGDISFPQALSMAIDALTAREPVKPTKDENATFWHWRCGGCGVPITEGDKFCRMCGKPVKWE